MLTLQHSNRLGLSSPHVSVIVQSGKVARRAIAVVATANVENLICGMCCEKACPAQVFASRRNTGATGTVDIGPTSRQRWFEGVAAAAIWFEGARSRISRVDESARERIRWVSWAHYIHCAVLDDFVTAEETAQKTGSERMKDARRTGLCHGSSRA